MKKKKSNNLPKLGFGATLAPQLFDLAANTLINGTTYAVTDMIKAIREPEQEMRPTKRNTGMVMQTGGVVNNDPKKKKKYVRVKGKKIIPTDAPEYKELYNQEMKRRAEGIYYDDYVVEEPLVVEGKKPTKKQMEKARAKIKADEEAMYNLLQSGVQAGSAEGLDKQGNYIPFEGGRPGIDGALGSAVLDFMNMGREDYTDGPIENVLEYVPFLGSAISIDDYTKAKKDLQGENKEGTFNNAIDMAGILPIGKYGNALRIPKYIEMAADALGLYGTVKDLYQDNISPMLSPNQNYPQIPKGYDMNQKLFDYQKNQPGSNNFATDEEEFAMGGMIKRADGSYSQRGLWDNIRANKGSGKKPTKKMLEQEREIRAQMDNGGTVYPYQERLNQSLRQPGFNPNIMGMSTGRNNVGLGFKGGPFRQMTSLTNDRKLNPIDNFTFNNNYTDPKFNLNTKLNYKDRFGFKGGVDYTSAIGENNPDTKFNVGFDKYGITGDYNYNLNKENPNFNYGVGYKGFGFDTDFRATKEKDKPYNFDAKLGYDKGNTSGNFNFTGNRDDYNLGADFRINGVGTNFKYANKKNDFKSNAPGFKNFKADAPDNNSNFNIGLLDYDKNGLSAKYAISKDNQNPLVHNANVGYSKKGLDAKLSFMGNKLDPKYNFNLNFVPEKAGPTTSADIDFKNNNLSIGTGLGYKSKKFNAGVNYKGSIDVEEETGKQSVNARAAYKGKNFNAGIDYDRQFATENKPAVNKAGLNLGYNRNGFNVNTGVKYKTLSEADKEKEKASPFEVTAGVTYNPNYKQPKQKTTPWKLPKELMKKNEVIKMINENQLTPRQKMLNALKAELSPSEYYAQSINLGKRAFGGMITPDMYMQQLMYGSYANGGQVPQNIPVEVEGGEAYELPNGEMGEFEGPSHDNGGIPVALPEQTKVYSKQLKVNGKTMADRKTKREANVAKLEKILSKNPSDKFIKEALKRQQETAALEEQQDMAMQEQANQQQQMQEQAQQGMMQEQAMAGMMQDPAMMQEMGMMMYGGTLNKLANGGEPCSPGFVKDASGNCVWAGDAAYKNTIPPGEGDIYSNFGSYPDVYYRKFVGPNDMMPNYSYFNPKGKETTWTDIPSTHPAYLQLYNGLKDNNQHFKAGMFPSKGVIEGGLFEQPYTSTNPEVGSVSNPNYDIMGVQPELDIKKIKWKIGRDLNSEREAYLKAEEEKKPKYQTLAAAAKATNQNPDKFPSDVEGTPNAVEINRAFRKGGSGKVNPPGVNPYDAMNSVLGNTFGSLAISKDPYFNTKGGMIPNLLYNEVIGNKMLREEDPKKPNKFMNWLNKAADETGDFFSGLFDKNGKPKKEGTKKEGAKKVDSDLPYTAGDLMGMAGTMFGGLAPMTTTMLNRMMTPKNQNFFREYGAEGLRAMQEAQALSAINRDKQLADIKLGEEASRQRGRNSARGVNTLRAMDISSDIAANQAQNQAYNSYAQQMMQLLGQKGQMENQQDQMVMQGEYQRDLADRQDVDQFYTNLAENFASQSELMQKQGRDMNQAQYNKMILQMSPMFSKYGIGMDVRNGQYVLTYNGEDIDQTKARLIVEKGIEAEKKAAVEATKEQEKVNKKKSIVPAFSLNYGQE